MIYGYRGQKYQHILVEVQNHIGVIILNRPQVLNALCRQSIDELIATLHNFDNDEDVRVVIITGNEKAFAAGADIKEMMDESAIGLMSKDHFAQWDRIKDVKIPVIAAVSGFALGGGCELAMACDMIVASESAQFGQPEINLGIIPGAGGTQRLPRAVGKYKAMEMILTGRPISAQEALSRGLVNMVVPRGAHLDEAKKLAAEIAGKSRLSVRLAKEAVRKSLDTPLNEGLNYERKNFYMLFASNDQKEGMRAFTEKRPPNFTGT